MQSIRKLVVVIVCAVAGLLAAPSVAQAELIVGEGCVSWSAANGCEAYQICAVDTDRGVWACCTYSLAGETCESGTITYPQLIASIERSGRQASIDRDEKHEALKSRGYAVPREKAVHGFSLSADGV